MARLPFHTVAIVTWAVLLLGGAHGSPFAFNPPEDVVGGRDLLAPRLSLQSRDLDPQACRLRIKSNTWDLCQEFIDRYKISLPNFYKMNPEVEADCYEFLAGQEYCISAVYNLAVSSDGSCGLVNGTAVTCVGSTFGECCGASGQCGSTEAFCAIGNCQFGNCPGAGYSFNGQCGPEFHNLKCGGKWGDCCSNAGVCGSTSAECGVGNCQSGACEAVTTSTTASTTSTFTTSMPTSTQTPPSSPFLPSPDGTCGYNNKYKCTDTLYYFGNCCSAAGFCSWAEDDCRDDYGCQPEYGLCDSHITVTVTTTGVPTTTSTPSTSTTTTTTTTTPTATPTSFCTQGTGPGGYLGLCDFSCYFGFCPSPCTCTQYSGTPNTAPPLTSDHGYALLGLDADYNALCDFTCSHSYCPGTACTTTPYSTEPGAGTVCVQGSGAGGYAGLCSFCCNFGYCPPGPCECTLYGAQISPPPETGTPGEPAPGIDASYTGLCSYACNHGYCPSGACVFS